jgi:Glycosyl transferases group 1
MRLLFVGESWLGSCARSLKEALARRSDVTVDEVNEDLYIPRPRARWLRAIARLLRSAYRRELYGQVLYRVDVFKPDIVVFYKGGPIEAAFVRHLRSLGCKVANVYPDCSPHAHGAQHKTAVGVYDLVISTKSFHPARWRSLYGYSNRCVFVPQGYDPQLHLVSTPPGDARFDVVMVATWRPEYGELMEQLGRLLAGRDISVAIGGHGWGAHQNGLPSHWTFPGGVQGSGYVELLRRGRICVAPLTRDVIINGVRQPGDEDTTRTYELAAAHCFFIHRRTELLQSLYDEATEVPMYDTAEELADKILHFLPLHRERALMASAAHRRAVPAYGLDSRARDVAAALADCLGQGRGDSTGTRRTEETTCVA